MSTIRITSGFLKGKTIPLPVEIKGHREVTPQKVKEALFQIISNRISNLQNTLFCDLFAGSGQIGFEAASRGFPEVVLCEIDRRRWRELQRLREQFSLNTLKIIKGDGFQLLAKLHYSEPITTLVVFADPPYPGGSHYPSPWQKLATIFAECSLNKNLLLIAQAPTEQSIFFPERKSYTYGKNCLIVFEKFKLDIENT